MLLRNRHPEEAHRLHLVDDVVRHLVVLGDGRLDRHEPLLDEAGDHGDELVEAFLGQRHGVDPIRKKGRRAQGGRTGPTLLGRATVPERPSGRPRTTTLARVLDLRRQIFEAVSEALFPLLQDGEGRGAPARERVARKFPAGPGRKVGLAPSEELPQGHPLRRSIEDDDRLAGLVRGCPGAVRRPSSGRPAAAVEIQGPVVANHPVAEAPGSPDEQTIAAAAEGDLRRAALLGARHDRPLAVRALQLQRFAVARNPACRARPDRHDAGPIGRLEPAVGRASARPVDAAVDHHRVARGRDSSEHAGKREPAEALSAEVPARHGPERRTGDRLRPPRVSDRDDQRMLGGLAEERSLDLDRGDILWILQCKGRIEEIPGELVGPLPGRVHRVAFEQPVVRPVAEPRVRRPSERLSLRVEAEELDVLRRPRPHWGVGEDRAAPVRLHPDRPPFAFRHGGRPALLRGKEQDVRSVDRRRVLRWQKPGDRAVVLEEGTGHAGKHDGGSSPRPCRVLAVERHPVLRLAAHESRPVGAEALRRAVDAFVEPSCRRRPEVPHGTTTRRVPEDASRRPSRAGLDPDPSGPPDREPSRPHSRRPRLAAASIRRDPVASQKDAIAGRVDAARGPGSPSGGHRPRADARAPHPASAREDAVPREGQRDLAFEQLERGGGRRRCEVDIPDPCRIGGPRDHPAPVDKGRTGVALGEVERGVRVQIQDV